VGSAVAGSHQDFRVITPDTRGALSELSRVFLGVDDTGTPDVAHVEGNFGDQAELVKSWHQGGEEHWRAIVRQTASMWLDYEGPTADEIGRIDVPVMVFAGDRD
jgi:hypothetical protein